MSELKSSADVLNRFMGEATAESAGRVAIKREDIRKGDRVRRISEFTAAGDSPEMVGMDSTYELIERPVALPTEPGYYLDKQGDAWKLTVPLGRWLCLTEHADGIEAERYAPFTLLRPVAEVAAEVLADVRRIFGPGALLLDEVDAIAAKFGVTK